MMAKKEGEKKGNKAKNETNLFCARKAKVSERVSRSGKIADWNTQTKQKNLAIASFQAHTPNEFLHTEPDSKGNESEKDS